MPVLNDFGPEAYARAVARMNAVAAGLGIQPEIIYQYFNDTAHLPQSIAELEAWGNKQNANYPAFTPRSPNGVWNVLRPGDTPGTRGAADPGFRHVITNEVDKAQRFQQVDEQGNIFGGSWDPEFNRAHPGGGTPEMMSGSGMRSAQGVDPSSPAYQAGNPSVPFGAYPASAQTGGGAPAAGGPAAGPTPAAGAFNDPAAGAAARTGIVDATAYGNTQTLQAQIDDAIRRYALARTTEERNQAYLDLQRWQTELKKAETAQGRYDSMAQALLAAGVQLQNSPRDYMKFNQYTSGGRDIFAQMQQAGPAFAGPTGPIEPGSVNDLLQRLGIGPSPATPATPAGVQPGAANPHNPELPVIPIPGTPGGPPGALQPGAGGVPAAAPGTTMSLPAYEQMLAELDRAAGGHWGGDRANRPTVAKTWWDADPTRRGKQMPAWS